MRKSNGMINISGLSLNKPILIESNEDKTRSRYKVVWEIIGGVIVFTSLIGWVVLGFVM